MPNDEVENTRKMLTLAVAAGIFAFRGGREDDVFAQAERFVAKGEARYGSLATLIGDNKP